MTTSPVDLNADLGEGSAHDAAVMPLVSSANIACGGHAGDESSMRAAVALARRHGTAIGGHPGHPDRVAFGRRALPISPPGAAELVAGQLRALARLAGDDLRHVKLHGALYHQVGHDPALGSAIARMLAADWPHLVLFAESGSPLLEIARAEGLSVAAESFADRRYAADGRLLPRSAPDAVLTDPRSVAAQALSIVQEGRVRTAAGGWHPMHADTLCVHGDADDPVGCLIAIRAALLGAGYGIG
jgi:UPF0271 protein